MTAVYISSLARAYPTIKTVWLIGSRADDSASASSDWDYIVVADWHTLNALSGDTAFNDTAIDLLVVYDGDNFRKPWPDGDRLKTGSLSGWGWRQVSETEATYRAAKPREDDDFYVLVTEGTARRVHPTC